MQSPGPADPTHSSSARGLLERVVVPLLERGDAVFMLSDSAAKVGKGIRSTSAAATSASGADAGGASRGDFRDPHLPSRFLSPRHAHGAHEVCWVIQGRCVLAVESSQLRLKAGDVCVVRPGEVHQLQPVPTLEPFDTLWWHVTAGGINLSLAGFAGDRHAIRGGFVPLAPTPVPALARVVQELEGNRPQRHLLVRTILLELAALILRHLDEAAAEASDTFAADRKGGVHVQRVAQYIEAHHGLDVTLQRLAQVAGLSPYYLTRLFGRYTGRGVMTYLGDVRHREAQALLRNTDLAVAEVARSVGYEDAYYFSRVFRSREGCAPLYYRRRFRNEPTLKPGARD